MAIPRRWQHVMLGLLDRIEDALDQMPPEAREALESRVAEAMLAASEPPAAPDAPRWMSRTEHLSYADELDGRVRRTADPRQAAIVRELAVAARADALRDGP